MVILKSQRVMAGGAIGPASIHVRGGKIERVSGISDIPEGAEVVDAGDAVIMPGVVDTHVHVNEPGRTEWEGFATATRAAAAGGVTTLVDMPLNSIPATTTRAALDTKRETAAGQCFVDVGFWGGVVPGNAGELGAMVAGGARGFKCFLVDSGVAEFECVGEAELRPAMRELSRLGVPLLAHAEVAGPIAEAVFALAGADPRKYDTYLRSRPPAAEEEAVALLARLCEELGARVHVVHQSASGVSDKVRAAAARGLPITAETCPHYLHLAAEDVPDGATAFKCAPPIRERVNREALWRGLGEGVISMVVSDHSPCTPALKKLDEGDFQAAWGGVAGLQLALPVVWTEAARRGYGLVDVARWMCETPARLAGLEGKKGRIAVGYDADLIVFSPERTFVVDDRRLEHRHKVCPYAGEELRGVVEATWLRGEKVGQRPRGELL